MSDSKDWFKNWQVIFKIRNSDGVVRDYCREQPPLITDMEAPDMIRCMNEEEVKVWAEETRVQHGLESFKIELWK